MYLTIINILLDMDFDARVFIANKKGHLKTPSLVYFSIFTTNSIIISLQNPQWYTVRDFLREIPVKFYYPPAMYGSSSLANIDFYVGFRKIKRVVIAKGKVVLCV